MNNDNGLIKVTVTMTKEDKRNLKQLALDLDTTASALIREWISEAYANQNKRV